MAHALFLLDTQEYRLTLVIFNTSCFSTAAMVTGTRLNIKLYVHYLPFFNEVQIAERNVKMDSVIQCKSTHAARAWHDSSPLLDTG